MLSCAIPGKPSLVNLQRLFVGDTFDPSKIGSYAILNGLNKKSYIVRVWRKLGLNPDCCIVDTSVETSSDDSPVDLYCSEVSLTYFPKINILKLAEILIVFKSPFGKDVWKKKKRELMKTIHEVLQLFVVKSDSLINVHAIEELKLLEIQYLKIIDVGVKTIGKIVDSTKLIIRSILSAQSFEQLHMSSPFPIIIGQDDVVKQFTGALKSRCLLTSETENFIYFQQVLLIGPGGCGKKSLVQKVCHDLGAVVMTLDLLELKQQSSSNSLAFFKQKLLFAQSLSEESPIGICVILIPSLENVGTKQGKMLLQLLSLLESTSLSQNLMVVATTDSPQSLHPSLRTANKFNRQFYFSLPSLQERRDIISNLWKSFEILECDLKEIAQNTPGFVLSDLCLLYRRFIREIESEHISRSEDVVSSLKASIQLVDPNVKKGLLGLVSKPESSLASLGGLASIKACLQQAVLWPLEHTDAFKHFNIKPSSGVLLYGPPGCAKTSLACGIASSIKTSFISITASDIYSPYVGDAERFISSLFQKARACSPCILFMDEIDALVGSRTFREKGVQERVLSAFLTEMDGIGVKLDQEPGMADGQRPQVFVIAATNRPQMIDSALLRPGRLDKLIYVPPPSFEDRLDILEKLTARMPLHKDVTLKKLAEETELYSGADLKNLCREAAMFALADRGMNVTEIIKEDFIKAKSGTIPSISQEQVQWYSDFRFESL